jgi:hypothetical protein
MRAYDQCTVHYDGPQALQTCYPLLGASGLHVRVTLYLQCEGTAHFHELLANVGVTPTGMVVVDRHSLSTGGRF